LHLAEVLAALAPEDSEAHGLAALIELSAARAPARANADGCFVPLAEQDPALWDAQLIARAHEHLRAAHARGRLGRFQLEAAIQAVHCARGPDGATDWPSLLDLHRTLHATAPSLGSTVALAAVTAEVDGAEAGLSVLDALAAEADRPARLFQPAKATRAHLLDRLGRWEEAAAAYESAINLTHDTGERRHLERRRDRAASQAAAQEPRSRD
jgi:RNA polymerase sigma-70 factor (ECF subfamily)